ncbi:MAG: sulfurtransferase [Myxococcales bacterium]|nr:sulfurtransferase [Myxococcales bacterium]
MPLVLMLWILLVPTAAAAEGPTAASAAVQAQERSKVDRDPQRIFVSAEQAAALSAAGATVLDARGRGFWLGHLPFAQPIDWRDYVDGWGRTGRLPSDAAAMASGLIARGVDVARPVLVYGDAHRGYGEEGRIAWLLSYLGHPQVHILDGGYAAWRQAGQPISRGPSGRPSALGALRPQPQPAVRADKAQVQAAVSGVSRSLVLDVRSETEWRGATPYFEARGGHIPGALSLDWRQLLDENGRLRDAAALRQALAALGVRSPDREGREIIVYCTGGVRSAFAWAVLRHLGYAQVRNYDGSFWEWAADRSLPVETVPARP